MGKRLTPDEYLQEILNELDQIEPRASNPAFGLLAAGSLESLLGSYSPVLIDRIEAEAKSNNAFALLLGGVWQTSIPNEIWHRIQAVQNMDGWLDDAEAEPSVHSVGGPSGQ